MNPSITECFSACVKQLLLARGRGAQQELAKRLGVTRSYVSNLLAGRKVSWPDPVKERVARFFGMTVAHMLLLGESYI